MKATTTEAKLKAGLVKHLRMPGVLPGGFVVFRHEDRITAGHPDISVTGGGWTTWFEGKHANPSFGTRGIQELTMMRLAKAGRAYYIIWSEPTQETIILSPAVMNEWQTHGHRTDGFRHTFISDFLRGSHV